MLATGVKVLKSVLLAAFLLCLVLEQQAQVEASICCPNKFARAAFEVCFHVTPTNMEKCALGAFCKYYPGPKVCRPDYPYYYVHHSLNRHPAAGEEGGDDALQLQFCRMGCTSALCEGSINALEGERCSDACYRLCANKNNARDDDTAAAAAAAAS